MVSSSSAMGSEEGTQDKPSMVARLKNKVKGVLDLNNTEDVDQTTTYAPAVTHEIIKPQVHEHVEEQIHRDTHTHDVYHKILPVRDVEVLPARHWVPGPDGRLIQVDEKDVPQYTGAAWTQGQADTPSQNLVNPDPVSYDKSNQAEVHQVDKPRVSPGLLDPYRTKGGTTNSDQTQEGRAMGQSTLGTSSNLSSESSDTSGQKISGHKIMTAQDGSGHTLLHKEPRHTFH